MRRWLRSRAPTLVFGLGVALALALAPGVARADITFTLGNNPPLGENVIFPGGAGPGTTLTGETNQSHTSVTFTSSQEIVAPSNGQARVQATSGDLNNITVGLTSGDTFTHFITNPFNGSGEATITVTEGNGSTDIFHMNLGNGQNFFTLSVTASNGSTIRTVGISGAEFTDLRQTRFGGFQGEVAPEPASMMLFSAGGLPFLGLFLRRRRRESET
jgi:hypothetical protein